MAEPGLDSGFSCPAQRDWPSFFRARVTANVQFWLDQIPGWSSPFEALYTERQNVTKALAMAFQGAGNSNLTARLLVAFHSVVERYGMWADWEPFLWDGIALCRRQDNRLQEAVLLDRLGEAKRHQGDWGGAAECHRSAGRLSGEAGNQAAGARALTNLAQIYHLQEQFAQAHQVLELALASYQACQDRAGQAFAHNMLGQVFYAQGQWAQALAHHQQALELWSEDRNPVGAAEAEQNLGNVYFGQGDLEQAERAYNRARDLYEQAGSFVHLARVSINLGNIFLRRGQFAQAERIYDDARQRLQTMGARLELAQVLNNLGMACARQGKWTAAESHYRRSIELRQQLGSPVELANVEDNLAETCIALGRPQEALAILGPVRARLQANEGQPRAARLLLDVEEHVAQAEAALSGKSLPNQA